jgi:hypothetical protein
LPPIHLSKADKSADNREVSQALQDYPRFRFLPFPSATAKLFATRPAKV